MSLIKASNLSISLLIFVLYICISSKPIYSQNPLIVRVCQKTTFPSECFMTMTSDPRTDAAKSIHVLAYIVVERIKAMVLFFFDKVREWMISSHGSLLQSLDTCFDHYLYIYEQTILLHESADKYEVTEAHSLVHWIKQHVSGCSSAIQASHSNTTIFNVAMERTAEILHIIISETDY